MTNVGALAAMGLALTGCPSNGTPDATVLPDAVSGTDAFAANDAFVANDVLVRTDAGTDANNDAFVVDAPVVGDAGPVIPPITMPLPHRVAASAAGHDRYFGVAFDDASGFYVTGQVQDGTAATDDIRTVVAHFTAAGELDTTFGTAGFYTNNFSVGAGGEIARGIALQSDGKIIIALTVEHVAAGADARDRDIAVARLLPNGTLDASFGTAGVALLDLSEGLVDGTNYRADQAYGVAVDPSNRILISAQRVRVGELDTDFAMLRLTPNGTRDMTFASAGVFTLDIGGTSGVPKGMLLGPDGSIYGSGYYSRSATVVSAVVYKLDTNGALVSSFGTGGVYDEAVLPLISEIYWLDLQGTNLVTAGYGRATGSTNDFLSIRISTTTGVRDRAYGGRGYMHLDSGWPLGDNSRCVVVLPDNRSLMTGQLRGPVTADATAGDQDAALVMLTPDGAFDTSFDTDGVFTTNFGGITDHFWAGAADPRSGRVVVVGIASAFPATNDDGAIYLFPSR